MKTTVVRFCFLLSLLLTASCKTTAPQPIEVAELLQRVEAATAEAKTMEADFVYKVDSAKQHQKVEGHLRLMKPNYARLTFSHIKRPAFPNLIASDGTTRYSYTSKSFQGKNPLAPTPASYDPKMEAKYASGLVKGGGVISTNVAEMDGSNLRLWDAAPVQAFFGAERAIRNYVYVSDLNDLKYEGVKVLDGVKYHVLYHYFPHGSIAGGERTPFEQRLFIGPDNLIHRYEMGFQSVGLPGKQIVQLKNIKVNRRMSPRDFAFTPPE